MNDRLDIEGVNVCVCINFPEANEEARNLKAGTDLISACLFEYLNRSNRQGS
jgi:hypothetical protein